MKISILTVTYNSAKTLRDTIESVRSQRYPDIEHIIVDGGSSDGTIDIIRSYPHITKWVSEKDNGLYDAMNKAIKMASGDIVGILNSDDVYDNAYVLARVMEAFTRDHCDGVYGDLLYVRQDNLGRVVRRWVAGKYRPSAFLWGWMPPHPSFFVRRSCYDRFGLFNSELNTAADYEFMLRIIHKHRSRVSYVPQVLVRMRTGGASNQTWKARILANRQDRQAWKINGLEPYWFTLYLKPLRKIFQFIIR